jgi:glutathione S-transferase
MTVADLRGLSRLETAMEIILYYAPAACLLVPYVTLTEANAAFEVRPLNFRKGEQMSAGYLKLNPKHKVPLLVVDGKPLTENVASLCREAKALALRFSAAETLVRRAHQRP